MLNELNLQLQGKENSMVNMISSVNAFKRKMQHLSSKLQRLDLGNIQNLASELETQWKDHFNTTFFKDRSFSWSWQSDFPLECTVYSVRIRTTEDESSTWSEWVDLEPASGSTLNACCVHKENATAAIMFNSTPYPLINISSTAKAITVKKLPMVPYGSFNIDCTVSSPEEDPVHQGRHFFIILYPPMLTDMSVHATGPRSLNVSWTLAGNLSALSLLCESELTTDHGKQILYPDNSQTNGPIEYYNLTWTSLQGLPHTNSIIIRAENGIQHEKRLWFSNVSYIITIQAKNSEGWSPPSTLTVPSAAKGEINITRQIIKGTNEGFNLTWKPETLVTCGYTVEWRDRSNISSSGLHWAKFNSTAAVITSAPTERPQIKHFRPQPHSVTLQWSFNEHSETNRGFILGYNICVKETSDITKANEALPAVWKSPEDQQGVMDYVVFILSPAGYHRGRKRELQGGPKTSLCPMTRKFVKGRATGFQGEEKNFYLTRK
ncbi:OSMR protein, partial [Polypterus senegalus]